MTYTNSDEKRDKTYEDARRHEAEEASEKSSKHKLPFLPADDDDSPLGSTDQHSTA